MVLTSTDTNIRISRSEHPKRLKLGQKLAEELLIEGGTATYIYRVGLQKVFTRNVQSNSPSWSSIEADMIARENPVLIRLSRSGSSSVLDCQRSWFLEGAFRHRSPAYKYRHCCGSSLNAYKVESSPT